MTAGGAHADRALALPARANAAHGATHEPEESPSHDSVDPVSIATSSRVMRDPFIPWRARRTVAPSWPPAGRARGPRAVAEMDEASPAASSAAPALLGFLVRAGERYALFAGRSAQAGDVIDGWTIKEIGEQSCRVERNGTTKMIAPGETL